MAEAHRSQKERAQLACVYGLMTGGAVLDSGEIATAGRISSPRASKALKALVALHAVRSGTPEELAWRRVGGGPGRAPQTAFCLPNAWGYAIGVAAGHHGVGTGLIDPRMAFREHRSEADECLVSESVDIARDYWATLEIIVDQILRCVARRAEQLDEIGQSRSLLGLEAITVALPGQIEHVRERDLDKRRVATVLDSFRDKPVAQDLRNLLARHEQTLGFDPRQIPIALENDADCTAIGELHWGMGQGRQSLLVIKVSAGVGAGIVINGALHYGTQATAGEIGHDAVHGTLLEHLDANTPAGLRPMDRSSPLFRCSCSPEPSAHLEAYASATAVVCRVLGKRKDEISAAEWNHALSRIVKRAVLKQDGPDAHAIRDAGLLIGRQVNTLATAIGPEQVLICGALAEAEMLLAAIHDQVEPVELPVTHAPSDVIFGTRGEEARWIGVRGAARLALERGIWGPTRKVAGYEWPGFSVAEALVYEEELNVNAR